MFGDFSVHGVYFIYEREFCDGLKVNGFVEWSATVVAFGFGFVLVNLVRKCSNLAIKITHTIEGGYYFDQIAHFVCIHTNTRCIVVDIPNYITTSPL